MSKISLFQIFHHIKKALSSCFLIYGNNDVLMQGVLREIEEDFASCHRSFSDLDEHVDFLKKPLLFGTKPRVTFVTDGINSKKVNVLLEKWPKDFVLIMTSKKNPVGLEKNIKKSSCYEVSKEESLLFFKRCAERKNLVLDDEIMSFCANHARNGLWSEWADFLSSYPKEKIDQNLVSEYADISFESSKEILSETSFLEGLSFLKINIFQRVLLQARWLKGALLSENLSEAKKKIYPTVFFKDINNIVSLSEKKSFDHLLEKMERSLLLEIMMKKHKK